MWQELKAVTILFTICPGLQRKKFSLLFSQEKEFNSFSLCHFHKEKNKILLVIYTRRKTIFLNLSNRRYFSGSKKPPWPTQM